VKVSWDDEIPNVWKIKKCPKPPTRLELTHMKPDKLRMIEINDDELI
jgi:hypothetical protein